MGGPHTQRTSRPPTRGQLQSSPTQSQPLGGHIPSGPADHQQGASSSVHPPNFRGPHTQRTSSPPTRGQQQCSPTKSQPLGGHIPSGPADHQQGASSSVHPPNFSH